MTRKTTTHTLETWVEIPVLVAYTYQPYEPDGKDSPGCEAQINIDEIELQSAAHIVPFEDDARKAVKTLDELRTFVQGEHEDALLEECWEAYESEKGDE